MNVYKEQLNIERIRTTYMSKVLLATKYALNSLDTELSTSMRDVVLEVFGTTKFSCTRSVYVALANLGCATAITPKNEVYLIGPANYQLGSLRMQKCISPGDEINMPSMSMFCNNVITKLNSTVSYTLGAYSEERGLVRLPGFMINWLKRFDNMSLAMCAVADLAYCVNAVVSSKRRSTAYDCLIEFADHYDLVDLEEPLIKVLEDTSWCRRFLTRRGVECKVPKSKTICVSLDETFIPELNILPLIACR